MKKIRIGKKILVIEHEDFSELVRKTYGKNYSFIHERQENACYFGQNTYHKIYCYKNELDKEQLEGLKFPDSLDLDTLCSDLCNRGLLPEGEHLVLVNW